MSLIQVMLKSSKIILKIHPCYFTNIFFLRWKYSSTVNLPQTKFPSRIHQLHISDHEKNIQSSCGFESLYRNQLEDDKLLKTFVLHDGPPYANGNVHVGHAVNKILKDITNRYKLLTGHKVFFEPGWDCHGLPIEIKAIKKTEQKHLTSIEVRKVAQEFAKTAAESQLNAFKRWGVMADWTKNCYFTFDKKYEATEIDIFYQLYTKGLVYQDLKPIYWSPSSKTALAEAELEYVDNHVSRSVYASFKMSTPRTLSSSGVDNLYLLSWTTQPWTLPSNKALCYNPHSIYCIVELADSKNSHNKEMYVVAQNCLGVVTKQTGHSFNVKETFQGSLLDGLSCLHPLDGSRTTPLIPASHVMADTGTGIVHTSPSHGVDDFKISQTHNLNSKSHVDDDGCFTTDAGFDLGGKFVFTDGNESVINKLDDNKTLFHEHKYSHSYPYDWRTKQPVIVKTSKQWFIDTNSLWQKSQKSLKNVCFHPPGGSTVMKQQLKQRPYWCISRQRVWGIPIPVFYHKETGKELITDDSIKHLISLFKKSGSDVWWNLPQTQLLPQSVIDQSNAPGCPDNYRRGDDILDIWFDSGISWAAVLKKNNLGKQVADFYLEGKDQYGGWFYSSLLTSVGLQGCAPYKNIIVHGFTVSQSGQKMSKSLGNVVDPMTLIEGGTDKVRHPAYGADTLRWWVASSNVFQEIQISDRIITQASQSVHKIRKCIRFLLGNLNNFDPGSFNLSDLRAVDQHQIFHLHQHMETITEAYEELNYSRVSLSTLTFVTSLNFYFNNVKDRLYCEEESGLLRHSCQTTFLLILDVLLKSVAPILPHLVEEAMLHHPCKTGKSRLFMDGWFQPTLDATSSNSDVVQAVEKAYVIRDEFLSKITGTKSYEYDVTIAVCGGELYDKLKLLQELETSSSSDLCEILMTSQCTLSTSVPPSVRDYHVTVEPSSRYNCPRCRRKTAPRSGKLCERCTSVLTSQWED